MKKVWMAGLVLGLVCQSVMADPAAANRIAQSKSYKPLTQKEFHLQYTSLSGKAAQDDLYPKYVKRWHAAKADGFLLDVNTFVISAGN